MLINLRNALMTGKRLPYDAEVEYLQSSGTQYIDTLVNADSNLSVEVTMATIAGTLWSNVNTAGAILLDPVLRHHLNFSTIGGSKTVNYYFGPGNTPIRSNYAPANQVPFTLRVDAIGKTFSIESFTVELPTGSFDTGLTYWLFARNNTGSATASTYMRIYSARLWNGLQLVRDFIPVRKGTVGYLYDRVSGELFGNAGTGDFVLGPDVVPATWVDGEYWDSLGVAQTLSGASRCDNFIPVEPSSTVTFYLGARPSGTTLRMIQYGSDRTRENSTYANNNVARTVTIPANCYFVRVSVETTKKNEAYIHDDTNDRDLLRNGMVVVG